MTNHDELHKLEGAQSIGDIIKDWIKQHNIQPEDLFTESDLMSWAEGKDLCDYDEAYQDGYDTGYGEGLTEKDD